MPAVPVNKSEPQQNGHAPPPGVENGVLTRADLNKHEELLKQQLQVNIQFLEKLFSNAEKQNGEIKELNQKLKSEQAGKAKLTAEKEQVMASTAAANSKCQSLESEVSKLRLNAVELQKQLEKATAELTTKAEDAQTSCLRQLSEKDQQLAQLAKELTDERGMREKLLQEAKLEQERALLNLKEGMTNLEDMLTGYKHMQDTVDSFHVGEGILEEPCGAYMLPNGNVVVADTLNGLFLFTNLGVLKRHVSSDLWKWPQGLVYDIDRGQVIATLIRKEESTGKWKRALGFFSIGLDELQFIDGPSLERGFDNVAKECLTLARRTGEFYIAVADGSGSGLWKLVDQDWQLVTSRPGATYTDAKVLSSSSDTSTDLLVIESKMGYLNRFTIEGSRLADRRTLAVVAKPNACCVDEAGNVFVHDIETGKIYMCVENGSGGYDTSRDVCLVDDAVFSLTASHGYLGVSVRKGKLVQIFRYTSGIYRMQTGGDGATRRQKKTVSFG